MSSGSVRLPVFRKKLKVRPAFALYLMILVAVAPFQGSSTAAQTQGGVSVPPPFNSDTMTLGPGYSGADAAVIAEAIQATGITSPKGEYETSAAYAERQRTAVRPSQPIAFLLNTRDRFGVGSIVSTAYNAEKQILSIRLQLSEKKIGGREIFGTYDLSGSILQSDHSPGTTAFGVTADVTNLITKSYSVAIDNGTWLTRRTPGYALEPALRPRGPSFDLKRRRIPSAFALRLHRKADISSGPLVRRPCRSSCLDLDPNQFHPPPTRTRKRIVPSAGVSSSCTRLLPRKELRLEIRRETSRTVQMPVIPFESRPSCRTRFRRQRHGQSRVRSRGQFDHIGVVRKVRFTLRTVQENGPEAYIFNRSAEHGARHIRAQILLLQGGQEKRKPDRVRDGNRYRKQQGEHGNKPRKTAPELQWVKAIIWPRFGRANHAKSHPLYRASSNPPGS